MAILDRRRLLSSLGFTALGATMGLSQTRIRRVLFVHGIAQGGLDKGVLLQNWITAFKDGLTKNGLNLPADIELAFPYYGDALSHMVTQYENGQLSRDSRGPAADEDFVNFKSSIVEGLRMQAGVSDAEVNAQFAPGDADRGVQNWAWVQAVLRALD